MNWNTMWNTFFEWNTLYQILGISLMVVLFLIIYKIYITTNREKYGIPRSS